jgi:hypothetical protein
MIDAGQQMPCFEPWHGHFGTTTPNPRAKEMSAALIEGSADYLTFMTEALLQSHNGIIRVFPAWPSDRDAQFSDLIAEGNISVSSRTRAGLVEFVRLHNRREVHADLRLKSPWTGQIECLQLSPGEIKVLSEDGSAIDIEQFPTSIGQAGPRKIWDDRYGAIWLGRPSDQRGSDV